MDNENVIAYIDGFNLYHAIDALDRPHLKWVNLRALIGSFLRPDQALIAVNYYSAYATWLPDAQSRHRQYTQALQATGVNVHISEFRNRHQECHRCGNRWVSREEKQTDVRMAVDIVADCLEHKFDLAVVITADSDMAPAVQRVRSISGKRLLMVAPPNRFNRARDLEFTHQIRQSRINLCLLPREIVEEGRVVATRPSQYDPPL